MATYNASGNIIPSEYYNCQDYGVLTTNADNTLALQALIDLLHSKGGGTIWVPVGTYKFLKDSSTGSMNGNAQNNVYLKSGVSIIGESITGSIFKLMGDTQTGCSMFGAFGGDQDTLVGGTYANFTVDLSEQTMASYTHKAKAFFVHGIRDCVFRDLRLISTPSTSMGIDMLDNVVLDSIYVYQGGRNWNYGGPGGAGIGIGTGLWENENFIIRNCICDSCGHFGIFLEDQGMFSAESTRNLPKGQIITNNIVRNGRHYGIGVRGGKNILISGNNVYENKGGIYLDYGAVNLVVSNNLVQGCTGNGLEFGGEDASFICDNISITGNTFIENAVAIKKTVTPTDVQEAGNVFIDNTSDGDAGASKEDGGGSGTPGQDGEDGGYYTPAVNNGVLSWKASKADMPAVPAANVKGDTGATGSKGDKGDKGDTGPAGADGITPHIGANGNWWLGDEDTGVSAGGGGSAGAGASETLVADITVTEDITQYDFPITEDVFSDLKKAREIICECNFKMPSADEGTTFGTVSIGLAKNWGMWATFVKDVKCLPYNGASYASESWLASHTLFPKTQTAMVTHYGTSVKNAGNAGVTGLNAPLIDPSSLMVGDRIRVAGGHNIGAGSTIKIYARE